MPFVPVNKNLCGKLYLLGSLVFCLSSCSFHIIKKAEKDKPVLVKNNIEVTGNTFPSAEKNNLRQRLNAQMDDSSVVRVVDKLLFFKIYKNPPFYDSAYAAQSARNMQASMLHIGYYKSKVKFKADTAYTHRMFSLLFNVPNSPPRARVTVNYAVEPGPPTLIDTVRYILRRPDLQQLAMNTKHNSLLKKGDPVTKATVLGEISRLVDLYRNNGYYKITAEELKMRGDTTTGALTTIGGDIFEQLRLLAEAQTSRDSPTIKLAVVLNQPSDSSKIRKYYIGNIYIMPDFKPGDRWNDPGLQERGPKSKSYIVRYHVKRFRTGFLSRHLFMKRGDIYRKDDYYNTLNSFAKAGVWQSVNIQVIERKDSVDKIDMVIQLIPMKMHGIELALEGSYSASSNSNTVTTANAGNLLGLSGNFSWLQRNFLKEGIRMASSVRGGVELNVKRNGANKSLINSNEVSLSNNIVFPRFIFPMKKFNRDKRILDAGTFVNTNVSYVNRIDLFNLQTFNLGLGYNWTIKPDNYKTRQWVIKPFNVEFARLYNETDSFKRTLQENPFLRYSFNTALVAGSGTSFKSISINPRHTNRQHSFNINLEESGMLWGPLGVLKKYMRKFVKTDIEYVYSSSHPKTAFVFRVFGGVGIASQKDTALPFFKQYFAGGSNSMRGWPVRGIGRGSQPLAPYSSNKFNDRTGDIQLEANLEYRYIIAQIIPNSLILKGALFCDIGNIWNLRNSKPGGGVDSAQFQFKNIYRDLGMGIGTGFRIDLSYLVLRFDLGFRVKRPEMAYVNDGWKLPSIGFDDVLQKLFSKNYKSWRYENMNFSIGISYPF